MPTPCLKTKPTINYQKEKNLSSSEFCHFSKPQSGSKRKRNNTQIPGSCQKAEKAVEHEGDGNTSCSWCCWNGPQKPGKETVGTDDHRTIQNT